MIKNVIIIVLALSVVSPTVREKTVEYTKQGRDMICRIEIGE